MTKPGYFHQNETPHPEIYSDLLFEQIDDLARDLDEERQKTFVINDQIYEWVGDSLRKKEVKPYS